MKRALIAMLLMATACSSSGGGGTAARSTAPDPCANPTATEVPASCIPGEGGNFEAIPSQSGAPPTSSAAIPAITQPAEPGELARGGNNQDASLTTKAFVVTLRAGQRLRTTLACQGAHNVVLTTTPTSAAEQTFACSYTSVAQLTVEDSVRVKTATRFVVKVAAPAPARWYVVISGISTPPPSG